MGVLVDAGGKDAYPTGFDDGQSKTDAPDSEKAKARNRGIALDHEGGAWTWSGSNPSGRARPC